MELNVQASALLAEITAENTGKRRIDLAHLHPAERPGTGGVAIGIQQQKRDQVSDSPGIAFGGVELGGGLLKPETYESFPPVGRFVIRGNGEKPHVLTLTMGCCPA